MPAIIIPSKWERLPLVPTTIDWNHASAFGLQAAIYALDGKKMVDAVRGKPADYGNITTAHAGGRNSFGRTSRAGTANWARTRSVLVTSVSRSMMWWGNALGSSTAVMMFDCVAGISGWNSLTVYRGDGSSSILRGRFRRTTDSATGLDYFGGSFVLDDGGSSGSYGRPHSIAITDDRAAGVQALYLDAVLDPVTGSTTDNYYASCDALVPLSSNSTNIHCNIAFLWNRPLSADEIAQLHPNPFQLLKPLTTRIYFDLAGGGGTTYYQSAAGVLTPAGYIYRKTGKVTVGTSTPTGSPTKKTSTTVEGSLTPTGSAFKKIGQFVSGVITAAGALSGNTGVMLFSQAVAGSITMTGALTRKTAKALLGTITVTGALYKKTARLLAGSITGSGTGTQAFTFRKSVAGSITAAGALARQFYAFVASSAVPAALTHLRRFLGRR